MQYCYGNFGLIIKSFPLFLSFKGGKYHLYFQETLGYHSAYALGT